jgi:hypothetical protein
MGRESVINDPEILQNVIKDMALGLPISEIAKAHEVSVKTVYGWKKRKDFKKILAEENLNAIREPLQAVRKSTPLAYIERHPVTREMWAPPRQKTEVGGDLADGFGAILRSLASNAKPREKLVGPEVVEAKVVKKREGQRAERQEQDNATDRQSKGQHKKYSIK